MTHVQIIGQVVVATRGGGFGGCRVSLHFAFWSIGGAGDLELMGGDVAIGDLVKHEHLCWAENRKKETVKGKIQNQILCLLNDHGEHKHGER